MGAGFRMTVRDVFTISGLGVAVTGQVEAGEVEPGDELELVAAERRTRVRVLALETFAGRIARASADLSEEVAVVLSGVTREEVEQGQTLVSPSS